MERRNFIVAGFLAIVYAILPWLRPKRYLFQLESFGGQDLRSMLRGDSEFRKLDMPYVIEDGVPIGMMPPHGWHLEAEPLCFSVDSDGNLQTQTYEELCSTGTTGGTRVTPASSKLKRTGHLESV
jgi:hypothetical protein